MFCVLFSPGFRHARTPKYATTESLTLEKKILWSKWRSASRAASRSASLTNGYNVTRPILITGRLKTPKLGDFKLHNLFFFFYPSSGIRMWHHRRDLAWSDESHHTQTHKPERLDFAFVCNVGIHIHHGTHTECSEMNPETRMPAFESTQIYIYIYILNLGVSPPPPHTQYFGVLNNAAEVSIPWQVWPGAHRAVTGNNGGVCLPIPLPWKDTWQRRITYQEEKKKEEETSHRK